MLHKFFDKSSSRNGVDAEPNYQFANEFHRQIIRKFIKAKSIFIVQRQYSLSKYNKRFNYLLCAIDLFSKYAQVVPLRDKRGIIIVNAFGKIILKG